MESITTSGLSLLKRIGRKTSSSTYRLFGYDNITLRRIKPRSDLRRLGSDYGGWFIPGSMLNDRSICYCAGCGEDITFDLALADTFGCSVYGFDPTPRAIAHVARVAADNVRYRFSPVGLWNSDTTLKFFEPKDPTHVSHSALNLQKTVSYFEAPVQRLRTIMESLGHSTLDLLKIDIEGAEYVVLDSLMEDNIPVRILCVEFDEYFQPMDADYRARIKAAVDKLCNAGYDMVCTEGNGNYTFVNATAG